MMEWKQTIFNQLRERNRQECDVYEEVVKRYNRLIENYSQILLRCTQQDRDILTLRQENVELQKDSNRLDNSPDNDRIRKLEHDYMKAKDESLILFREKRDMLIEVTSLSRVIEEKDEKIYSEENKNQILTKENTTLKQRLESAEDKLSGLQKVNQTIYDENQVLELAYTSLENRYKELEATNTILRGEMTDKVDAMGAAFNKEIELHLIQMDNYTKLNLDEAISTSSNTA